MTIKQAIVTEGKVKVKVPVCESEDVSKKLPVFYNPLMQMNRDISVILLKALDKKNLRVGLPLAASGVRGIRFLAELDSDQIQEIYFNDLSEEAVESIKSNLELNHELIASIQTNLGKDKIHISCEDANKFLLEHGFDYIDIDPFGSPISFLNNAITHLSKSGILAVTATDTSLLCGTYSKKCVRKYWSKPVRNWLMHEVGLRILIRKVQMVGMQFEKALTPILSYSADHYMRVFFVCDISKSKSDSIAKLHRLLYYCPDCCFNGADSSKHDSNLCKRVALESSGDIWLGSLFDSGLLSKMDELLESNNDVDKKTAKLISNLTQESKIDCAGIYDLHVICKKHKLGIPKEKIFLEVLGSSVASHLSKNGLRTKKPIKEIVDAVIGVVS